LKGAGWFGCHIEAGERMGGKATLGVMLIRWRDDGWPRVAPPEQ
jgi:hypothetical protein